MSWQVVTNNSQVLAIHAAVLHTYEILYFGGAENNKAQNDAARQGDLTQIDNTRLFHTRTNSITTLTSPTTDVFCSGHAFLADGRLLVGGGTDAWGLVGGPHHEHFPGHRACWRYDLMTRSWTRVAAMRPEPGRESTNQGGGRWYPTLLTLANGEVLAVAGHPLEVDSRHHNNAPERYLPDRDVWQLVRGEAVGPAHEHSIVVYYPRMHLLPSGQIFFSSAIPSSVPPYDSKNRIYDPNTGRFSAPPIDLPGEDLYNGIGGSSVLLPLLPADNFTPRVLVCGGIRPRRINLGGPLPFWQDAGARTGAAAGRVRLNCCAVLLPTGEVFVSGGVSPAPDGSLPDTNAVLQGEIYMPGIDWVTGAYTGTQNWRSVEPATVPRNYHSVALLMPNGCVWAAGSSKNSQGGDPADVGEMRVEVYKPAYDADPNRPEIAACPANIRHGETFQVRSPQAATIRRIALLRAGSVTHAFDGDQRYVGLRFSYAGGDRLRVTAPPHGGVSPPGYYMLWIVDEIGRPCKLAKFVKCASRTAPSLGTSVSLQSYNYPAHSIRHSNYLGEISVVRTELDRRDATFKIVSGLADDRCVSLESRNYPNHYLRHQDYRLKLHPRAEDQLYKEDATFSLVPGLANPRWSSLRSFNYPDRYVRHRDYHLWVESGSSDLFRKDATFKIVSPLADNTLLMSYRSLRSSNYPTRFARHAFSLGELTEVHSDLDRRDATFRIIPGLADDRCVSFEASNFPGHYLRHQDYRLKLHPRSEDRLFEEDATFLIIGGLADASASSFRSFNYPDRYVRHKDFHLWVEAGSDELFRKDATFTITGPFWQP